MTAVMAVWSFVKRLPLAVWALVGGVALVLGLVWSIQAYGDARYLAGRADVLRSAQVDSATRAWAGAVVRQAETHTDAVVRRTRATVRQVAPVVQAVPDSLRAVPEITALIRTTETLAAQVDTLNRALDMERAAHQLRASVDSAQIVALGVLNRQLVADNRRLEKRPRWRTVASGVVVGVALGFVGGLAR